MITEEKQREIRTALARAQGYTVQPVGDPKHPPFYQLVNPADIEPRYHRWRKTEAEAWADAPDPFQSADDSRALIAWLAQQSRLVQDKFNSSITRTEASYGMPLRAIEALNASLLMIALAVYEAIKS